MQAQAVSGTEEKEGAPAVATWADNVGLGPLRCGEERRAGLRWGKVQAGRRQGR
jgi:hypothetical protein